MIKINLAREGRAAVRGGAGAGAPAAGGGGPANLNVLLIGALAIAGLVLAGGYWFIKYRENQGMEELVAQRTIEAQKLDAIIKEVQKFEQRKDSLEKRIALINDLKKKQRGPVKIMDRISQDLPDLVWLDRMVLAGTRITIDGRALNPNAVANFVENIKTDPLFSEPELSNVTQERVRATTVYRFSMAFNFKYEAEPAAPEPGGPAPAGDTTATSAGR